MMKPEPSSASKKLKQLFSGKRPFRDRLKLAVFPALSLSFILFFFGPLDQVCNNSNDVPYSVFEILLPVLCLWAGVFVCLWLAASIPGGKLHAGVISLYVGAAFACWVQGAFLNPNLGVLDGRTIAWDSRSGRMLLNLLIWLILLEIPHWIHYFSIRVWKRFVLLIPIMLLLMQGVTLGTKLVRQKALYDSDSQKAVLLTEDRFALGRKNNVLVILLDSVTDDLLLKTDEFFPGSMYTLRDFTRFENCGSDYLNTFPSIAELLTGTLYDGNRETYSEYSKRAWASESAETFYGALHEAGYAAKLFITPNDVAPQNPMGMSGKIDNAVPLTKSKTLNLSAFRKLIDLSFFRYVPICLKPFFVIYTSDIADVLMTGESGFDPWETVEQYNREGVRLGEDDNLFSFYYFMGTHSPRKLDENGKVVYRDDQPDTTTSQYHQLAGYLTILRSWFAQMRDYGIYDDSLIIILADHGFFDVPAEQHQPIFLVKRPGERHDETQVSDAPIISQENFMPTVLEAIGADHSSLGMTAFEMPDTPRERCTHIFTTDESLPNSDSCNCILEYCYTGGNPELTDVFLNNDYRMIPIKDCFY